MRTLWIVVGSVAAVLLLVGVAAGLGVLRLVPGSGSARPACDQLVSVAEATSALDANPDLVTALQSSGDGVEVGVETPCEDADAALIQVLVTSGDERDAVDAVLTEQTGFGVPVQVVRG